MTQFFRHWFEHIGDLNFTVDIETLTLAQPRNQPDIAIMLRYEHRHSFVTSPLPPTTTTNSQIVRRLYIAEFLQTYYIQG
jgi:hypothetical protein